MFTEHQQACLSALKFLGATTLLLLLLALMVYAAQQ